MSGRGIQFIIDGIAFRQHGKAVYRALSSGSEVPVALMV
jgi:hypothetical protein